MWTLDESIELVRRLMPGAKECRYDLSLGGGVLRTGMSKNDLDIICGPSNWREDHDSATAEDFETFLLWLTSIPGLRLISQNPADGFGWNEMSRAYRFEDERGRKIDFFVQFHPGRVTRFARQKWSNVYTGSCP